jgi:hypothetical protein
LDIFFALVCGINTSLENQENVTSLILNDIGNQIENIANKTAEDILLEMTKKIIWVASQVFPFL